MNSDWLRAIYTHAGDHESRDRSPVVSDERPDIRDKLLSLPPFHHHHQDSIYCLFTSRCRRPAVVWKDGIAVSHPAEPEAKQDERRPTWTGVGFGCVGIIIIAQKACHLSSLAMQRDDAMRLTG